MANDFSPSTSDLPISIWDVDVVEKSTSFSTHINLLLKNMATETASRITMIPGLCGGRPTIRGMRIRVTDILDYLAGGETRLSLLAEFTELQDEDISAALYFASEVLSQPEKANEAAE
jgi:uncharacterized protein (DUF433 family)